LRAALFRPLSQEDEHFGHLAETAVFSQWFHSPRTAPLHYARWADGEIDLVSLNGPEQLPDWFTEVKWSDRHLTQRDFWNGISKFIDLHGKSLKSGIVTSRSVLDNRKINGLPIGVVPTSIYAWMVGRNVVESMADDLEALDTQDEPRLL
jgi:uncharacterized protein